MKKLLPILTFCLFCLNCEQGWLKDILVPPVEGCTNSSSCNYNSDAEENDGNCIAKQGCNEWCEGDSLDIKETDCSGECGGSAIINECGECAGGNTGLDVNYFISCTGECHPDSHVGCNQAENQMCGQAYVDVCGDCVGGNTGLDSCVNDCLGVPGGTAVEDCAGVCGGTAVVDSCNVCGGTILVADDCPQCVDGLELGCDLVCAVNPKVLDECGVCGGNGIPSWECDCDGNALDCSDVCGGTDLSCQTGCTNPNACNFDANATIFDDSCWFLTGSCVCNDGKGAVADNCGTCDADSSNDCVQDCAGTWGGSAVDTDGNGICDSDEPVYGCTNPSACNFDANATIFDDSCWSATDGCACSDGEGSVADECGTCDTDASNDCVQDCADVWGGSDVIDVCNECGGDGEDANGDGLCDEWQGTVDDIHGNTYKTIKIGDQWWMAENLKVTKYNDGSDIPTGYSGVEWFQLSTGAYAVYDNNSSNADIYGYLYNWFAVDNSKGICPSGWHVPTGGYTPSVNEYSILADYLGGGPVAGGKLKEAGTTHWNSPNTGATNESGFTALPGGYRRYHLDGVFSELGNGAYFWTSTGAGGFADSYTRTIDYDKSSFDPGGVEPARGLSVRCLKD